MRKKKAWAVGQTYDKYEYLFLLVLLDAKTIVGHMSAKPAKSAKSATFFILGWCYRLAFLKNSEELAAKF